MGTKKGRINPPSADGWMVMMMMMMMMMIYEEDFLEGRGGGRGWGGEGRHVAKREAPSPPGLVGERVLDFWNADHWGLPGTTSQVAHCSLLSLVYIYPYTWTHTKKCTNVWRLHARAHLRYSWGPTNRDKRRPPWLLSGGCCSPLLHCTCSALSLRLNYCRERGRERRRRRRRRIPVLNAFQNGRWRGGGEDVERERDDWRGFSTNYGRPRPIVGTVARG